MVQEECYEGVHAIVHRATYILGSPCRRVMYEGSVCKR